MPGHRGLRPVGCAAGAGPGGAPGSRRRCGPAPGDPPLIAILCYHDISDTTGAQEQTVSPDFLRKQIRACRTAGWSFLPLREVLAARMHPERLPARVLVLTFDDGYRSFLDQALPVLREEHVPATLSIISSFVDHPPSDLPPLL